MDIATLTNAPREIMLDGRPYTVSALKFREWGVLQAFIKDHATSPVGRLRSGDMAGLSDADRQFVLREAFLEMKGWPPRVGSLDWMNLLDETPGGNEHFLMAVLGKHQPVTEEEAARLAETLSRSDTIRVAAAALGLEMPDPKGGTPAAGSISPPAGTNGGPSSTASAGAATG